jgi:hypothetical protein
VEEYGPHSLPLLESWQIGNHQPFQQASLVVALALPLHHASLVNSASTNHNQATHEQRCNDALQPASLRLGPA